jgi:hypothetical protein
MPVPLSPPPDGMPSEVIDFRTRTVMPDEDVDALWVSRPGFLEAAIQGALANITARLRKRYKTPFTAAGGSNPRPEIVVVWQTKIVTPEAYRARGYNPADDQLKVLDEDRKQAFEEIKEAADAVDGLYDLPLLETEDASGIVKGAPLSSSDASPYAWIDAQSDALARTR